MLGSQGEVKEASPSIAVQMQGLNSVPVAGDTFHVCENEAEVGPGRITRKARSCWSPGTGAQPPGRGVMWAARHPCCVCKAALEPAPGQQCM